jgi:hypothetical protein
MVQISFWAMPTLQHDFAFNSVLNSLTALHKRCSKESPSLYSGPPSRCYACLKRARNTIGSAALQGTRSKVWRVRFIVFPCPYPDAASVCRWGQGLPAVVRQGGPSATATGPRANVGVQSGLCDACAAPCFLRQRQYHPGSDMTGTAPYATMGGCIARSAPTAFPTPHTYRKCRPCNWQGRSQAPRRGQRPSSRRQGPGKCTTSATS